MMACVPARCLKIGLYRLKVTLRVRVWLHSAAAYKGLLTGCRPRSYKFPMGDIVLREIAHFSGL